MTSWELLSDVSAKRANLVCDHRKASPVIARARRLDSGVQRQQTGLVRDAADRLRDFADIPRAPLELRNDLYRRALPLRVALDRPSGSGDPLRRVAKQIWTFSVRRRNASVSPRAVRRPSNIRLIATSCSCDAPAASSAPAAICSIDLRNCSAAAEASVSPLANSSVAAATRSNRASGDSAPSLWVGTGGLALGFGFDGLGIGAVLIAAAAIFEL